MCKKNFHRDLCGGWVRGGHKEIPLGKKCKNELVVCVCRIQWKWHDEKKEIPRANSNEQKV